MPDIIDDSSRGSGLCSFLTVLRFVLAGGTFTGGLACPCQGFIFISIQGRVRFSITLRLLPLFLKCGPIIFLSAQLRVQDVQKVL